MPSRIHSTHLLKVFDHTFRSMPEVIFVIDLVSSFRLGKYLSDPLYRHRPKNRMEETLANKGNASS